MLEKVLYVDPNEVRRALMELVQDEAERKGWVVALIL